MKRSEKAAKILDMLEEFYPETPVPLDHENPFQLLIAVLMSAQTTDKKVNQVTPELFRHGPNAEKMAKLEVSHIQEMIREVGLAPTKAKNISKLAKILLNHMKERSQILSKVWNHFQALVTKLPELLWLKHLEFLHFQLTHTFTDLQQDGAYRMGQMS